MDAHGKASSRLVERPEISPVAECDEFAERDRKAAVEFSLLRQIGQAMARKRGAGDLTGHWPNDPGQHFQERAFPGPVWADDCGHARWRKISGHALQRKMFAIAHGKIAHRDSAVAALSGPVECAGIVAAIEMAGGSGVRARAPRPKQKTPPPPPRGGSAAPPTPHIP